MLLPAGEERWSGRWEDIGLKLRRRQAWEIGGSNCPVRRRNSFRVSRAKWQKISSPEEPAGRSCAATAARQTGRPVYGSGRGFRELRRGSDGSKLRRCRTKE